MHEYQIQRGDKTADRQRVAEIYLELLELTIADQTCQLVPVWPTGRR